MYNLKNVTPTKNIVKKNNTSSSAKKNKHILLKKNFSKKLN